MRKKEFEFRTEKCNLLCFKVVHDEDSHVSISFKNGKREEVITLDKFVDKMNTLCAETDLQLQIVFN